MCLIVTDVPDIYSRNAKQGLLPLMVAVLAGKRHAVKWFVYATCIDNDVKCATVDDDPDSVSLILTRDNRQDSLCLASSCDPDVLD